MTEQRDPQNTQIKVPESLSNSIEQVLANPKSSLGTAVSPYSAVELRWSREDGSSGVILWDSERGLRKHERQAKVETVNYKGDSLRKQSKSTSWELAGNIAEVAGRFAGGIIKSNK